MAVSVSIDQDAILIFRLVILSLLRACSPSDPAAYDSQSLIDALFPPDALLCLALDTAASAQTWPRERWRGIEQNHALLVSSPMTATLGFNQQGQHSCRCLDNTGPRRFLVIEADHGDLDRQAAALLHLARKEGPLVMVVHSGGKSLHGWFYCAGQPEPRLRCFFEKATSLGADPATWTRCQLVRMPGAVRPDTGRRQEVLFLNTAACPGFLPEGLCPACWRAGRGPPQQSHSVPPPGKEGRLMPPAQLLANDSEPLLNDWPPVLPPPRFFDDLKAPDFEMPEVLIDGFVHRGGKILISAPLWKRDDQIATTLKGSGEAGRPPESTVADILALLPPDEEISTGEWQRLCYTEGVQRSSFYKLKAKAEEQGYLESRKDGRQVLWKRKRDKNDSYPELFAKPRSDEA